MKLLIAALLAATATTAGAVTYDPFAGFSAASNPNGVYSYGYEATLGGALTLFTTSGAANGQPSSWTSPAVDRYLGVYKLTTTLLQHPGPNGQFSILRLTLPGSGLYRISGAYSNGDNATTDVHVLTNGTGVVTGAIAGPGTSTAFDFRQRLAAGSTVDFAVGNGGNYYYYDSTLLSATVTSVPEPASWALLIAGFAMVGVAARRRSALTA